MTKQQHQSTQFMMLAMAAVFAVVSVLILTKTGIPETQVQGAADISEEELLNQLNQTVDDAGQSDLRVIKGEVYE